MCIMNYYECAVICKNTELNLTLADQGVLMGTGSFANNCHLAGCQVMGNGTEIINTVPPFSEFIPITSIALIITSIALIIVSLVVWQKGNKK